MSQALSRSAVALALALCATSGRAQGPEQELLGLIGADRPWAVVPDALFERLGWDLPDGGEQVRRLAEATPRSAIDPEALEKLDATRLGYRPRWYAHRYSYYGLEWDVTGLLLEPLAPEPGLPTLAFINGGSANWYEFFVDPLNQPGLGQYLAQRIPVLLITIPGNYRPGGWEEPPEQRRPRYLLDRELGDDEIAARNAIFTFTLIVEGVAQLVEEAVPGRLLIAGHSTGGEIQYLLRDRLKGKLAGLSIGWGTGGPAHVRRGWDEERGEAGDSGYPPVTQVRARSARGYVGSYIGPLNPVPGGTPLEVAEGWFARSSGRRPQFKQVLQDVEHRGERQLRERVAGEIRAVLARTDLGVDAEEGVADLFSTLRTPLDGYRRMLFMVGSLDRGHWAEDPERAREVEVAAAFREANPGLAARVVAFATPMTHYGHIEKPRPLAAALVTGVRWLTEEEAP